MKKILTLLSILASSVVVAASGLESTNEVLTVNQDGKISDSGVATIEALATKPKKETTKKSTVKRKTTKKTK